MSTFSTDPACRSLFYYMYIMSRHLEAHRSRSISQKHSKKAPSRYLFRQNAVLDSHFHVAHMYCSYIHMLHLLVLLIPLVLFILKGSSPYYVSLEPVPSKRSWFLDIRDRLPIPAKRSCCSRCHRSSVQRTLCHSSPEVKKNCAEKILMSHL